MAKVLGSKHGVLVRRGFCHVAFKEIPLDLRKTAGFSNIFYDCLEGRLVEAGSVAFCRH